MQPELSTHSHSEGHMTNIQFPEGQPIRLDLACGGNKTQGFFGIDKYKTDVSDYEFDLLSGTWPIDSGVVDEIICSHFFEHIPGLQRPAFMEECYRIMKTGSKLQIITPHWSSARSVQDFSHAWPPVAESSFLYFNKNWREANKLTHGLYDIKADFNFTYGYSIDQDVSSRNQEYQSFAAKHYNNALMDVYVTLIKI